MSKNIRSWVLKICLGLMIFQTQKGNSSSEFFGIIGGRDNGVSDPYAALVAADGTTTPLSGPAIPTGNGLINGVAINASGSGIIGGSDNAAPYIALVSPSGVTTALSGPAIPTGNGVINGVAINASGSGIIGGSDNAAPYIALVSPSGVTTALSGPALPPASGSISDVAINDSGSALILGNSGTFAIYGAVVSPTGVTTPLSGPALPVGTGPATAVAINASGSGIIGGSDNFSSAPYVALVSPSGVTTPLSGLVLPNGNGRIFSVAINDAGSGIIGGQDNGFTTHYIALISSTGVTAPLSGSTLALPSGNGSILSVAINNAGAAIIGGTENGNTTPYAALVSPTGVTTALSGPALPVGTGQITSVAITHSGLGIIGGQDNGSTTPYVALVSPSGVTTALNGSALPVGTGQIFSVACFSSDGNGLSSILDPKSFGPRNAYADPLFALSTVVLRNHLSRPIEIVNESLSLVADASDRIYPPPAETKRSNYAFWISPFGLYAHYKKGDSFPSIRDRGVGGIVGFDYTGWQRGVLGGGLAYAFQDIHYSQNLGRAKAHQELATLYGAWYGSYVTIEGALWGGIYQLYNYRKTLGFISSKSLIHGGLLNPHLSVQTPITCAKLTITPFASSDWVNNWQGKVREHGSAGLNLRLKSHYTSLLRSEVGLRLSQYKEVKYGTYKLEEGISYVNKIPFNAGKVSTFYVGSFSTFNLQLFDGQIQNLGSFYLGGLFTPKKVTSPFIALNYQGEWGKKQFSHTLALEIKQRF